MTSQVSSCTKEDKENQRKCSLPVEALYTEDYKSRELKSKQYVSLAANDSKSIKQRIYIRKRNSPFESLMSERKQKKCRVGFLTQFKTNVGQVFPGIKI